MNIGVVNTPGYFYALAYCVSCLIGVTCCKKRYSRIVTTVFSIIFIITLISFMYFTDGIQLLFFLPCIFISIGIMFCYIYKSCKMTLIQAGFYCARAFIIGEFMASLAWQIAYFGSTKDLYEINLYTNLIFITIVYSITFVVFYLIEKYYFGLQKIKIHPRELATVIMITSSVFLISNLNYIYYNASINTTFTRDFFTIRTLVDFSGVVVLYAYHTQKKEFESKHKLFLLQNILNIQYLNYKMMQESMDIVNQKYHDLKHQIFLLKKEATTDEAIDYLSKMEADIKLYEVHMNTGHHILDTVLTGKSLHCKSKNISFTCVVDGKILSFMDDMDICALFGNLLDNSMEAVQKIENIEERIIHLSVALKKNFVSIRLSNQCIDNRIFKNEIPKTTKKNKNIHGFGLKSIESTVQKYDGVLSMDMVNNTFNVRILIPTS